MTRSILAFGLTLLLTPAASRADMVSFYIGVDGRTTVPSGTYAGLDNPNHGRLTLLYNHGDHYHAKGAYVHTGPNLGDGTEVTVSPSNYLPEGSAPRFALERGEGVFSGLYVSGKAPDVEGSDIAIGSVEALRGFGPEADETVLLNSSGGRWEGSIAEAEIVIELVGATAGLSILDAAGSPIFAGGTTFALGLAGAALNFSPIFAAAAPGDYSAMFRVHDARANGFASSGVFEYRFTAAVPEPGSLALSAAGGLAASIVGLRNRLRRVGTKA